MSTTQGGSARNTDRSAGLFAALKNIAATLLASGRTRLELLGTELEEEKLRAIRLLVVALAMVFCLGIAILLGVSLLTLIFWDSKILVLGLFTGLFVLAGGLFYQAFVRATHREQPPFAASIAELEEDLRRLKAAVRHDAKTD